MDGQLRHRGDTELGRNLDFNPDRVVPTKCSALLCSLDLFLSEFCLPSKAQAPNLQHNENYPAILLPGALPK